MLVKVNMFVNMGEQVIIIGHFVCVFEGCQSWSEILNLISNLIFVIWTMVRTTCLW